MRSAALMDSAVSYDHCGIGRPSPQPTSPSLSVSLTSTNGAVSPALPALPDAKRKVLVIGKRIGKTSMFSIVLIDLLLLVRGDQLHDGRRGLPQRLNPVELFDLSPQIYRCP